MLGKLKSFVNNNPKLAVSILGAALLLLILFFSSYDSIAKNWPSEALIAKNMDLLTSKQKELQRELDKQEQLSKARDSYVSHSAYFWIPQRDGDPEANAQKVVEDAAAAAGLKLTSVGRVNQSKLLEGVNSMEISVQASGEVEDVNGFIEQIYRKNPRFYWSSLTMSVDNVKNPTKIILNGSLRFISLSDDDIVKKMLSMGKGKAGNNKAVSQSPDKPKAMEEVKPPAEVEESEEAADDDDVKDDDKVKEAPAPTPKDAKPLPPIPQPQKNVKSKFAPEHRGENVNPGK